MTFNALMLPAPPPTSTGELKAAGNLGPTALKSGRLDESTRGTKSFLATLNQVSHRQCPSRSQAACTKVAAEVSAGSGKATPDSEKTGEPTNAIPDRAEDSGTASSAMPLFEFGMTDDNSLSNKAPSKNAAGSNSVSLGNLMDYFQPQKQGSLIDWLAGIGSFEQMEADISAQAINRSLIEQLAARAAFHQGTESMMGTQTELVGLWQWLMSSPEGALNSPAASFSPNADKLLAAFLNMQQTVVASSTLSANAVEAAGQSATGILETTQLNNDFLVNMRMASLLGESDLSENPKLAENPKMAGMGKDAPVPLWMTANPNSVAAEAITQKEDPGSSIKSAVLKAENLPIAELSSKITAIEGDNKDGGFMFAQDQLPEHLKTLGSVTRTLEGAQRGLASQTMDQIVHRAILLLHNEQQEVRLELKPEFLGHIRMQIVTENQQVAIKIVAESPLVKDMLESNLNQLKAQLQSQGLAIDELEVSVAHDSYADADANHAEKVAKLQGVRNRTDFLEESSEKSNQSQFRGGVAMAETAIDYFA